MIYHPLHNSKKKSTCLNEPEVKLNKKCKSCEEKENIIKALQKTIETQTEYIELLKKQVQ